MDESRFYQIKNYFKESGEADYRWEQLTTAVFEQGIVDFEKMTTLPKDMRQGLKKEFGRILCLKPIARAESDQAVKILFELEDGERIESVKMNYRNKQREWTSLCISSQVGCGLGCSFCSTGQIGLKRNLTADEIVSQVLFFEHQGVHLESITFMGMGEPLVNPNIFEALDLLTHPDLFNYSQRRLIVSTVGIAPQLEKLIKKYNQINIAFSIHTPFQDQREEIMPIAKKYSIDDIMSILDEHIRLNKRKVFLPYLMLKGVNDSMKHACALRDLIFKRRDIAYLYHINLIPYHSTEDFDLGYECSSLQNIDSFREVFEQTRIGVSVRQSFGQEIQAACGQLYGRYKRDIEI